MTGVLVEAGWWRESAHFIAAGKENLFAVLTQTEREAADRAVLLLHAGPNFTAHRNGQWTRLARELAGRGRMVLRLDYHGSGDSSGVLLDRSLDSQTGRDLDAALAFLRERGAREIAIVGTCWGGLVGLAAAARADDVPSVHLVSSPLHLLERPVGDLKARGQVTSNRAALTRLLEPTVLHLLRSDPAYRRWLLRRARSRIARMRGRRVVPGGAAGRPRSNSVPPAAELYPALQSKGVRVHALFGRPEPYYRELTTAGAAPLLSRHAGMFEVEVAPMRVHGFTSLEAQEAVRLYVLAAFGAEEVSR